MAALEHTITPGELALSGGSLLELRTFGASLPEAVRFHRTRFIRVADVPEQTRDDLITLDSPFTAVPIQESESLDTPASPFRAPSVASSAASLSSSKDDEFLPAVEVQGVDIKASWATLPSFTVRGWSERSVAAVVRRVRSLGHPVLTVASNRPPFEGAADFRSRRM